MLMILVLGLLGPHAIHLQRTNKLLYVRHAAFLELAEDLVTIVVHLEGTCCHQLGGGEAQHEDQAEGIHLILAHPLHQLGLWHLEDLEQVGPEKEQPEACHLGIPNDLCDQLVLVAWGVVHTMALQLGMLQAQSMLELQEVLLVMSRNTEGKVHHVVKTFRRVVLSEMLR